MKRLPLLLTVGIIACATSAWAEDTAAYWDKECSKCHAKDGSGDTPMGKRLKLGDYRDGAVQAGFTDEEATAAIKDGVKEDGKTRMKGYGEKLTDEEIAELVAKVRSLKQ